MIGFEAGNVADSHIEELHKHFTWIWPLLRDCGFIGGIKQNCQVAAKPADYLIFWLLGQLALLHPEVTPTTHSTHRAWEKLAPLLQTTFSRPSQI